MTPHCDKIYSQKLICKLIELIEVCLRRWFSVGEDFTLVGPFIFCPLFSLMFSCSFMKLMMSVNCFRILPQLCLV
jgi:hypothetical protein